MRRVHIKCFRIGGDEFAVLMIDVSRELRRTVEEKLSALGQSLMCAEEGSPTVTLSIGVAVSRREDSSQNIFSGCGCGALRGQGAWPKRLSVLRRLKSVYDAQLFELTRHAFRLFLFAGFSILASSFFTALDNGLISAAILFFADACVPDIVGYPAAADFLMWTVSGTPSRWQSCSPRSFR